ncbi:MAG: hypothetical protein JRG97_07085 [Deltaproteobacteria bacterium]|nr:hypothetical protein [Deltaproteobacteria bacterium]MBW2140821.1 hypothetical protein [Deltaproteobacteria bacterium]
MARKKHFIKAECPECGCGLINHLAPDIYRQKFGDGAKEIEIECPMCGKKHQAVLHEEEEK